jgi:general secretion pathway protein I
MLAQLCADNTLNQLRLAQQMPNVGQSRAPCSQAERSFEVVLNVSPTPNPAFRRVNAQVFDGNSPILNIATVLGRY